MLLNQSHVKQYAKSLRPNLRVSSSYMAALNAKVAELIEAHVGVNGSRKTMTDAVIDYCSQAKALSNVDRKKVR